MISIIVNDTELDLDNVSINLVLRSPMASGEGSYSFPFTFPASPKNKKVFSFANRIQKKDSIVLEYPSKIFFKGIPLFEGSLVVSETASKYFKAYFKSDSGKLLSELKDLKLSEINYGDPYVVPGDHQEDQLQFLNNCINLRFPHSDFAIFPGYFKNKIYSKWDWLENSFTGDLQISLYLNTVLHAAVKHIGMDLSYNKFKQDSELNSLLLWNNHLVNVDSATQFNYSQLVPDISMKQLLDDLGTLFNVWPFVNTKQNTLSLRNFDDLLKNGKITNIGDIEKDSFVITPEENKTWSLNIDMQGRDDYYPDEIDINNVDELYRAPDVMSENALTIGEPGDYHKVQRVVNQHLWYLLQTDDEGNDEVIPACPDTAVFQTDEGDTLSSLTATACNDRILDPVSFWYDPGIPGHTPTFITRNRWLLMPRTDIEAYSWQKKEQLSSRLLFFRGIINDMRDGNGLPTTPPEILPKPFPFASAGRYDMNGNSHGNYRLSFDGPDGLVENFWKQTMDWRANRKYVQFNKRYTAAELAALDFSEIRNTGDALILPEEIRVTISTKGISKAKVKAWTV